VVVESTSGTGYGLDVGLSLALPFGLRAAVSGTNVMQRMTWDESLTAHTATFSDSEMDANDFVDLLDEYASAPLDPNGVTLPVYQTAVRLLDDAYFPSTFRAGIGFQSGGTSLELVGVQVSPRGRQRTAWDERLSLGVEQIIPVLTLRAGIAQAQDGIRALTGGFALRLGPVHLDAAAGLFQGDDETSTVYDGGYATFSLQVKGGGS
jgi:hypothetical protein